MIDKLQTILQHFLFMLSVTCKNTNVSIPSVACISLIRIYKLWLAPGNYFHFSKFNFPLILSLSYNIKHFGAFIILQNWIVQFFTFHHQTMICTTCLLQFTPRFRFTVLHLIWYSNQKQPASQFQFVLRFPTDFWQIYYVHRHNLMPLISDVIFFTNIHISFIRPTHQYFQMSISNPDIIFSLICAALWFYWVLWL